MVINLEEKIHFSAWWKRIQKKVHDLAVEKGFWENKKRNEAEIIALLHSECSEALEALRAGNPNSKHISCSELEEELADLVIRVMDYAEFKGYNLSNTIIDKLEFNKNRSHKHNKQF